MPRVLDIPAKEHRVVFVNGVVAVLHVAARKLPKPNREGDLVTTIIHPSNSVDILAGPFLPLRRRLSIPRQNAALLEVDVDVVTPASTAVLDVPDLQVSERGCRGYPTHVGTQHLLVIRLDPPGLVDVQRELLVLGLVHGVTEFGEEFAQALGGVARHRTVGHPTLGQRVVDRVRVRDRTASELEGSVARLQQFLGADVGHGKHRLLSRHVFRRVHALVVAERLLVVAGNRLAPEVGIRRIRPRSRTGNDAHLHELAHGAIAVLVRSRQDLCQGNRLVWAFPVPVLQEIHHVELRAGRVPRKIDHDVEALRDGLRGQDAVVVFQLSITIQIHAAVEGHRVLHHVPVVGDEVKGCRVVGGIRLFTGKLPFAVVSLGDDRDTEEARDVSCQDPIAVTTRANVLVGVVEQVRGHHVSHESIVVEGRKPELPPGIVDGGPLVAGSVLAPGLGGDDQVDVVIPVSPGVALIL